MGLPLSKSGKPAAFPALSMTSEYQAMQIPLEPHGAERLAQQIRREQPPHPGFAQSREHLDGLHHCDLSISTAREKVPFHKLRENMVPLWISIQLPSWTHRSRLVLRASAGISKSSRAGCDPCSEGIRAAASVATVRPPERQGLKGINTSEGRGRWWRGWDSNPRGPCGPTSFQDWRIQPLCHPSRKPNLAQFIDGRRTTGRRRLPGVGTP